MSDTRTNEELAAVVRDNTANNESDVRFAATELLRRLTKAEADVSRLVEAGYAVADFSYSESAEAEWNTTVESVKRG